MNEGKLFKKDFYFTDGGLETTLVFERDIFLPNFCAFVLLKTRDGQQELKRYYEKYLQLLTGKNFGFILDTPTWRASSDWGSKLDIRQDELEQINKNSALLVKSIAEEFNDVATIISGTIGPRGDGYNPTKKMWTLESYKYHSAQIMSLKDDVDIITAMTMNYVEEAIGISQVCSDVDIPVVISFTVETDGRLPDGTNLSDAINLVDNNVDKKPIYYMINCAHPTHYMQQIIRGGDWLSRLGGLRSNASVLSHCELDDSTTLDSGEPEEFAELHRIILKRIPSLRVIGGCCGTGCTHVSNLISMRSNYSS